MLRKASKGITLIEALVAGALTGILVTGLFAVVSFMADSIELVSAQRQLQEENAVLTGYLQRQIEMADTIRVDGTVGAGADAFRDTIYLDSGGVQFLKVWKQPGEIWRDLNTVGVARVPVPYELPLMDAGDPAEKIFVVRDGGRIVDIRLKLAKVPKPGDTIPYPRTVTTARCKQGTNL